MAEPRPRAASHRPPKTAAGRAAVSPFVVMEVLAAANRRAAAGREVLHLEVGEPMGPPAAVVEAAQRALAERAPLGYTEALGLRPLRERIARHYGEWYGIDLDPARVAVTLGASGAFILAFLAAFDAGDRVAVAEPGYPAYRNILRALGVEVVRLPVGPETRFQPTPALLDAAPGGRLDGLVVASPANPTGTVLGRAELAALVDHCADRGMRLVADEIYHGITYGEPAAGVLEVGGDGEGGAIVVNSFSKYFRMTGWRLGWLVLPPELTGPVERLAQNLFISAPTLAQHAALAAFECDAELRTEVDRYRLNRDLLLQRLPAAGLTRLAPVDGAFYLYADVGHLTADSPALCRRLLDETGVAVTPGVDFDTERGGGYVRLSFAGPTGEVAAAAERLSAWLRRAAAAG